MTHSIPAILVLDDGRCFAGESFGAPGEVIGPMAFVTGTTGYQTTLTDPHHAGELLVAVAPHIGNTGWVDDESGPVQVKGYVIRDLSPRPSSWRARRPLADELADRRVVGIAGVDTRALTRHLRDHGPMMGAISTTDLDPDSLLATLRAATSSTTGSTNA